MQKPKCKGKFLFERVGDWMWLVIPETFPTDYSLGLPPRPTEYGWVKQKD